MTHALKVWPGGFAAIAAGVKVHEVRRADRDFKAGDALILREFIPNGSTDVKTRESLGKYTGWHLLRRVTYVTQPGSWGLPSDVCVLSLGTYSGALPALPSEKSASSAVEPGISSPS